MLLKKKVELAGKRVEVAVSTQADKLIGLIKRKKIIRKPIPSEEKLSSTTRKLLSRFDKGTITSKQLVKLNSAIEKEVGRGLLERAFFADPTAKARLSRLFTSEKEASLLEVLAGDVRFKGAKPQILIFENVRIQAFPKTKIFNTIKNKLKTGRILTKAEAEALLKFQLKTSGKFKPIGFVGRESEIVGAPGDIISKVKNIGSVLINGKKVSIVRASIKKASKETQSLLKKFRKNKITKKELTELNKRLKKESGFKYTLSRRRLDGRPLFPVRRKLASAIIRRARRAKVRRRIPKRIPKIKKVVRRKPVKPPRKPPVKIPRVRPPVKPPRRPKIGIPRRPKIGIPRKPPVKVPVIVPRIKIKKPRKKVKPKPRSYHTYVRPLKKVKGKKPKLIRVTRKPVSKLRARDIGSFLTDRSIARTHKIKGSRLKPKKSKLKVPVGYYAKTRKKFRGYKIVKGKRIPLKQKWIERRGKPLIDTLGEKRGLTARRRLAQLRKQSGIKRRTKKKSKVKRRTKSLSPTINLNSLLRI